MFNENTTKELINKILVRAKHAKQIDDDTVDLAEMKIKRFGNHKTITFKNGHGEEYTIYTVVEVTGKLMKKLEVLWKE